MQLFIGPLSLFARKVEIALREKGLPYDRVVVPFSQTKGYQPKHPQVVAANPKGQVPVMVDGELTLFDSTVIFEYLEDAYPEPPLYPREPVERARCRLLDLFADEIMLVPLQALMHRTTPGEREAGRWAANEEKAKEAEARLAAQFAELDDKLGNRPFFLSSFGAADISVFTAVFYALRLGGPTPDARRALADWYWRLLDRPAFSAVAHEILEADRELSAPVDGAFGGGRWLPERPGG